MKRAQDFPPSPVRSNSDGTPADGKTFLAFTSENGSRSSGEKYSAFNDQGGVSLLIDSGPNSHVTPFRDALIDIRKTTNPSGDMRILVDRDSRTERHNRIEGCTLSPVHMVSYCELRRSLERKREGFWLRNTRELHHSLQKRSRYQLD